MKEVSLIIVGGGSAGLSAAISAYDKGIKDILILERNPRLGGILNQCIHNGFGLGEFKEELTGPEFALRFISQVEERKIPYLLNTYVTNISKDKVVTYSNEEGFFEVKAKAIIYTAGCYERSAGAIALPGDRPSGIMSAGVAQLLLNLYGYLPGKKIFILGSGDIGLIMARRLTLEGAKVLGVAELCPWSNGLNRNIVQCLEDFSIPLYLSHTVSKVIGKNRLEAIELSEVDENKKIIEGTAKRIPCDTLILSIGLIPNNTLLSNIGVKVGASRGALVDEHYETSLPGIFSAGNVLHVHDLVDNVVVEARKAGEEAAKYILNGKQNATKTISVKADNGIGYVVPGILNYPLEEKTTFKFRVKKPEKNIYVVLKADNKEIKRFYKPFLIPSEMELLNVPSSLLEANKEISISVVEKEDK